MAAWINLLRVKMQFYATSTSQVLHTVSHLLRDPVDTAAISQWTGNHPAPFWSTSGVIAERLREEMMQRWET